MAALRLPLLEGDVVLRRENKKVGFARVRCAEKVPAGTNVLDRLEYLVEVVVAGPLAEMIKGVQLLKVDDGLGITDSQRAFHHAARHRDPLGTA